MVSVGHSVFKTGALDHSATPPETTARFLARRLEGSRIALSVASNRATTTWMSVISKPCRGASGRSVAAKDKPSLVAKAKPLGDQGGMSVATQAKCYAYAFTPGFAQILGTIRCNRLFLYGHGEADRWLPDAASAPPRASAGVGRGRLVDRVRGVPHAPQGAGRGQAALRAGGAGRARGRAPVARGGA